MNSLRLTVAARRDLGIIQDKGLADFGVVAVRAHMQGFERIFALLRAHPAAGQARPEYGKDIRIFSHRPHRIFYQADGRDILIVRVLHASMDARDALSGQQ